MACPCGERKRVYFDNKLITFMKIKFKRTGKTINYAGKKFEFGKVYDIDLMENVAKAIKKLPGYEILDDEIKEIEKSEPEVKEPIEEKKVESKNPETEEIEIEIDENFCQYIIEPKNSKPHQCRNTPKKDKNFCSKHLNN